MRSRGAFLRGRGPWAPTAELLDELVRQLRRYDPERIVLFGSAARADMHEGSDLDVLIVKETDRRFVDRIRDVLALLDLPVRVDPLVYTADELRWMLREGNDFLATAVAEGKVLYERQQR